MRWLTLLTLLLFTTSLRAAELPDSLARPPGCEPLHITHHDYGTAEVRVRLTPGAQLLTQRVFGRFWQSGFSCPGQAFPLEGWADALRKQGWEVLVLTKQSLHAQQGDRRFLSSTGNLVYVERAEPAPFALPQPAVQPEELRADADVPWLPPLPDTMPVKRELADAKAFVEVTNTRTGQTFLRPPFVRNRYIGRSESLGGVEEQTRYHNALVAAGWDILYEGIGGVVIAHYTKGGRDLWAKVTPFGREYLLEAGDAGAREQQQKLAEELQRQGHVALYGIYFDTASAEPKPESENTLQQIRALLLASPKLKIEVQGHTDNIGQRLDNQALSEARAQRIVRWLCEHGIEASRLGAKGYADSLPVTDNGTAHARALNRRVELAQTR